MKVLNDFTELISALDAVIKKEKTEEYKPFLERIKANIALWQTRYDSFLEYTKRKKTSKEDK